MKHFTQKFLLTITVTTILLTACGISASAKKALLKLPKTMYMTIYKDGETNSHRLFSFEGIGIKNLTSDNPTVAEAEIQTYENTRSECIVTAKKAGTTTLTFQYGEKKYSTELHVVKYKNAVSSIKIGDTVIDGSEFMKGVMKESEMEPYKDKSGKIRISLNSGWKLKNNGYQYATSDTSDYSTVQKNGKSVKFRTNWFGISFIAVNKKTGQELQYFVNFRV